MLCSRKKLKMISANQLKFRELEIRRNQLNEMRTLFQQSYANLLVLNQNSGSDPTQRQDQRGADF